jgi:hypothetical protein
MGDEPGRRPLPVQENFDTEKMPGMGFEVTIQVFK